MLVAKTIGSWAADSRCFLHWGISYYLWPSVLQAPITFAQRVQPICFLTSPLAGVVLPLCGLLLHSRQPEQCLAHVDAQ